MLRIKIRINLQHSDSNYYAGSGSYPKSKKVVYSGAGRFVYLLFKFLNLLTFRKIKSLREKWQIIVCLQIFESREDPDSDPYHWGHPIGSNIIGGESWTCSRYNGINCSPSKSRETVALPPILEKILSHWSFNIYPSKYSPSAVIGFRTG